jgi:transcriptional regulator
MYIPRDFQVQDPDQALALIRAHPLGMLVHVHAGGLDANHIPWELETLAPEDGGTRLIGHVARANPLAQQLCDDDAVLVVFRAEHAYISPNWYPSKHDTHLLVPTWNYRVVHVHGRVRVHTDQRFLLRVLGKLSRTHENRIHEQMPDPAGPWGPKHMPHDALMERLQHIVGLEIAVERLEAKFKLSQNRSDADRLAAAQKVSAAGTPELGSAMAGSPAQT